ncbi:MAG: acyltransferase [Thermosynechococcaceae cyanobacterium]
MKLLRNIKFYFRVPKISMKAWFSHQEIQCLNPDCYLSYPIVLIYDDSKSIKIGAESTIDSFSEIVVRRHSPYSKILGKLTIGTRVVIGSNANIRAAGGEIWIGNNSLIAQHVSLIASGHVLSLFQPYRDLPWDESKTGVYIGDNVWIGANVTVLPGCNIGRNSIIGAGSVVTKSVPANQVWVGVPAKKLKNIETQSAGVMVL